MPTEIVRLLENAGLHVIGTYKGLSKTLYAADGPDVGGRLGIIAVRD
ncbi:MAG TPA: hypothetical protein VFB14_18330 [Bryobacteraceae bacterium]|nr:hypothetical protein [Bryobacteraceae bacterium]